MSDEKLTIIEAAEGDVVLGLPNSAKLGNRKGLSVWAINPRSALLLAKELIDASMEAEKQRQSDDH